MVTKSRCFPSPRARLSLLEPFSISPEERDALLLVMEELESALGDLNLFVSQDAMPALGFDPARGGDK